MFWGLFSHIFCKRWSKPYIQEVLHDCRCGKKQMPEETPLVLYINRNGGVLERMQETGVDVIGFDWTVDMADGSVGILGNVDPAYLFSPLLPLTDEIRRL